MAPVALGRLCRQPHIRASDRRRHRLARHGVRTRAAAQSAAAAPGSDPVAALDCCWRCIFVPSHTRSILASLPGAGCPPR